MFEEMSFQEYKDKYMFKFEQDIVQFDSGEFLRALLRKTPLFVLAYIALDTILELYQAKFEVLIMEEQEMQVFDNLRRVYRNQLLLNDKTYDRSQFIWLKFLFFPRENPSTVW